MGPGKAFGCVGGWTLSVAAGSTHPDVVSAHALVRNRSCSFAVDLNSDAACKTLAEAVGKQHPKVHILFNNAGVTWGGTCGRRRLHGD